MRRLLLASIGLFLLASISNGCTFWSKTKRALVADPGSYLEAKTTPELYIPEHMDHGIIIDSWVVPTIQDRPLAKVFPAGAPRPVAIVGQADPDLVRIRKLGERTWMVVQRAPETVWPVIKQYLEDDGVVLRMEDATQGLLISDVLVLDGALAGTVQGMVVNGKTAAATSGGADWVAIRVENGIRRGSAEVHLRYVNEAQLSDDPAWPQESTDLEIERTILTALAQYDAGGEVEPTVSSIGRQIALQTKAEVTLDESGFPLLRLNVDFERAWATVSGAIRNAELEITSSDVEQRTFNISVTKDMLGDKQGGIFRKLMPGSSEEERRYVQVRVEEDGAGFNVRLFREGDTSMSIDLAQQILSLLREYAA